MYSIAIHFHLLTSSLAFCIFVPLLLCLEFICQEGGLHINEKLLDSRYANDFFLHLLSGHQIIICTSNNGDFVASGVWSTCHKQSCYSTSYVVCTANSHIDLLFLSLATRLMCKPDTILHY